MRLALIAHHYPPLCTSASIQLRDLSREFVRQGHDLTVIVAAQDLDVPWRLDVLEGVQVLRLKTPKYIDVGYVRRTMGECLMPFWMWWNLKKSPFYQQRWEGLIWYSPTIFLGPLIRRLKKISQCKAYLIVRDIFPQWAVDLGIMRKGLIYHFFNAVAHNQYALADVIGIQAQGNSVYFKTWGSRVGRRLEVLQNWLAQAPVLPCRIVIEDTPLAGRIIFVYAGNMGVAQGIEVFLDLADALKTRSDIGFLFVGRGSDAGRLQKKAEALHLLNVCFFDEIEAKEIPGLYAQCHIGMVGLDLRHKTHNIPGKFLSYMQGGLPVLAHINPGNDLIDIIQSAQVGKVSLGENPADLVQQAQELVAILQEDPQIKYRCTALANRLFSPQTAVRQIVEGLA